MCKLEKITALAKPTQGMVSAVHLNRSISFLFTLFILLLSSCGRDDDTVVLEDKEEFNAEELNTMSTFLEQSILSNADFTVINPEATSEMAEFYEYLDRNYQAMVNTDRVNNRNKFNWSIHVLKDDDSKNTFMTPGGAMYITTGLLKTIRTEHELISILAHEINYTDSGILLEKLKEMGFDGTILFEVINGLNPPELPDMATQLQNISYTEEEVQIADDYAVGIICDFLYNPHGMRDFLKRIMSTEEDVAWLINRPSTENRQKLIEQSAAGCGPGGTFEERYQEFLKKLQ